MNTAVVVQEALPQYRISFFEGLRDDLASNGVNLRLIHGRSGADFRLRGDEAQISWAEPVVNRYLPAPRSGGRAVWQPVFRCVRDADLVILEAANRQLVNYPMLARRGLTRRPRVAFWGHGANLQSERSNGAAEKLHGKLACLPDWWFAYTEGSAQRVRQYGFPGSRITVVQNAIDTADYTGDRTPDKVPGRCVFVGGLYREKRLAYLLEAGQHLAATDSRFELHVIGNGPQRELIEHAAAGLPWLRYRGALFGKQKAELVQTSTLMLMPGLVGLVVLDAFAARTPLVTTDYPFHSPEYDYLETGRNGLVLPRNAAPHAYAEEIASLMADPSRLSALQKGCAAGAQKYTLRTMIQRYSAGIQAAIES